MRTYADACGRMLTYADVCSGYYRRRRLCTRGCFRCTLSLPRTASSLPSETWYVSYVISYVSMRPHAAAYVSIRQHTSAYVYIRCTLSLPRTASSLPSETWYVSSQPSIRQHTSACGSIRQHTSAYVHMLTSAYVSIRQHTSAYVDRHALSPLPFAHVVYIRMLTYAMYADVC
jgi:hypothetical protein